MQPTAGFVMDTGVDFETGVMRRALRTTVGEEGIDFVNATALATALVGDAIAANLFMLGYAFQKGLVPLGVAAISRAIELNGTAVEASKLAFAWGRLAAHDLATVLARARPLLREESAQEAASLEAIVEHRIAELTAYQDAAYARRYREFVGEVTDAERRTTGTTGSFAGAVARNLFKLMAYKDEYEVARLYTSGAFLDKLGRQFEGDFKLSFHLAPPILAAKDPASGRLKKREYGAWMFTALKLLARFKRLRGTRLDPFGYTAERRAERELIESYTKLIRDVAANLSKANHATAVELANIPDLIRGFGHVKVGSIARARAREDELVKRFREPALIAQAAE
jgi:indolepyruvate ferredoxin oxidoreductase